MNTMLRRLLCLLLACVMLSSMLPGITAFAAETDQMIGSGQIAKRPYYISKTYEEKTIENTRIINYVEPGKDGELRYTQKTVTDTETILIPTVHQIARPSTGAIGETSWGETTFTTFEDLVQLAAKTYSDYTTVYYDGEEPLTIERNLKIPRNMGINFWNADSELIIPKGVTLESMQNAGSIFVDTLTVQGTFISRSYLRVNDKLDVTGSMTAYSEIAVDYDAEIIGASKITFANTWAKLRIDCSADDFSDVADYIAVAKKNTGKNYVISLYTDEGITLNSSLTFPENANLDIYGNNLFTIASGKTLTLNGDNNYVGCPLNVKGKIVNNNYLYLRRYANESCTFAGTSSYSGRGLLTISTETGYDYEDLITGLDFDDFDTIHEQPQHNYYQLRYGAGKTRLGKPTNLAWNKGVVYTWNNNTITGESLATDPGAISWKIASPKGDSDYHEFAIAVYKRNSSGKGEEIYRQYWGYSKAYYENINYFSLSSLDSGIAESGTYYFTIEVVDSEGSYRNSTVAQSSDWTYTKPSSQYGKCTSVKWDWPNATWTGVSGAGEYQVEFSYASGKNDPPYSVGWMLTSGNQIELWEDFIANNGGGYYSFRVRAVSDDITKKAHGAWVESPVYYHDGVDSLDAPVVTATNVASSGKIKLSWDPVWGASKYYIYRATSKTGEYKYITSTTNTSLTNTSIEAGKAYYYKVKAVSAGGVYSKYSNVASRTCDLARPDITVSNVASSGKLKISWDAVDGAEKYYVYRRVGTSGEYKYLTSTTKTSLTNTSTEAGTKYYYKVKAIHENTAANSAYSSAKSSTCDLPRPSISTSIVASSGKIKVSWNEIDGAVKYYVYRSTSKDGEYSYLTSTTKTSLTNTSAVAGNTYYYKVKAVHSVSAATSALSSASGRTCDLPRPNLEITLSSSGKPKLSWDAIDGAVKYYIYRSTSADGEFKYLTSTTKTSLTNTSVEAGVTYYYKVKAVHSNINANSALSSAKSITAE